MKKQFWYFIFLLLYLLSSLHPTMININADSAIIAPRSNIKSKEIFELNKDNIDNDPLPRLTGIKFANPHKYIASWLKTTPKDISPV